MEALEDEPNSTFQRQVVCEEDDSFTLSEGNLFAVEEYLQELETRVETNRVKAEKMRQRIFSLMSKLEINPEEKQLIQLNLSGHTPSIINQVPSHVIRFIRHRILTIAPAPQNSWMFVCESSRC